MNKDQISIQIWNQIGNQINDQIGFQIWRPIRLEVNKYYTEG